MQELKEFLLRVSSLTAAAPEVARGILGRLVRLCRNEQQTAQKTAFFDCCKGKEKDSILLIDAKLSPLVTYYLCHRVT